MFGLVENDLVFLSPLGVIARDRLVQIPEHHSTVTVDSYVVMPNHVHALLRLDEQREVELGDVVATYKAAVSRAARHKGLWQRGYHDHIVRDEHDLQRIHDYIATNPIRWALDPENPNRTS